MQRQGLCDLGGACGGPGCQDGDTGLIMAAQEGHVEAARLLLEHKADVNKTNKVRETVR